jgi:hypothetical protein
MSIRSGCACPRAKNGGLQNLHWVTPAFAQDNEYTFKLGYGDIVPKTSPAQMISSLEATTGQLYLAILVARLIGIHLISASKP